jgi:hypothetical protein
MRKKLFYLLIISSIFFACEKNRNMLSFQHSTKINGINLEGPELIINSPSKLKCLKNYLVILNSKNNYHITLVNKRNKSFIETGSKGKGPGEMIMPISLRKCLVEKRFEVYDFSRKKLYRFDIDSCSVYKSTSQPLDAIDIQTSSQDNSQLILSVAAIENNNILMYGLFDDYYMFQICDSTFNPISKFGTYAFNEDDNNLNINKCLAYQGTFEVNDSLLVWSCNNAQIIEVYNLSDLNKIQKVASLKLSYPLYKPHNIGNGHASGYLKENKRGYIDLSISDDKIYALYSGKKFKKEDISYDTRSNDIQVFDYDLNPIENITLNKDVNNISFSHIDNSIYTICHEPEQKIIYFEL